MKLEIGSEKVKSKLGLDWKTMDIIASKDVDIVHDITKLPLPLDSDSCEIIYMSHVLEHIPWTQTSKLLRDLYRCLKKGGSLEVWVPDLEKLAKAYLNPSLIKNDGWYKYNPDKDPTRWFNGRLFTYGPGMENFHRAAFDTRYLTKCLTEAGFTQTEKLKKPRGYDHGWINLGMKGVK
jgi:predicted SAM-dependent methyltransferase